MEGFGQGGFPRATNEVERPELGDPERWGGTDKFAINVPPIVGTYEGRGQQIIRVQTPNLIARGWVVLVHFKAEGLDLAAPDEPHFYVDIDVGTGQRTQKVTMNCGLLARSQVIFRDVQNASGQTTDGACITPAPIPGSALAIVPWAQVSKRVMGPLDHLVTFTFEISVSPWSLR